MKEGEGGSLMHVYVWEHIVHPIEQIDGCWPNLVEMKLSWPCTYAQAFRPDPRWIQGGAKIGQWGAPSPKDFYFRSECNSNKPNTSSYPELKNRDCLLFGVISQIWKSYFLINHLLRNLNFNSRDHCTQVSDQCPLGLLLYISPHCPVTRIILIEYTWIPIGRRIVTSHLKHFRVPILVHSWTRPGCAI